MAKRLQRPTLEQRQGKLNAELHCLRSNWTLLDQMLLQMEQELPGKKHEVANFKLYNGLSGQLPMTFDEIAERENHHGNGYARQCCLNVLARLKQMEWK